MKLPPQDIPAVQAHRVPVPVPPDLLVLDVREDDEWRAGHIDGAMHVPLSQLPQRVEEIASPGGRVLAVCRVGARSAQATMFLRRHGRDVVNLDGGMHAWSSAGRPMVSETGRPPEVV
ncbi:MAG: rhodanese-like domain-containing protein [Actinomycetota bacterium]|nr:rhodanese-like domain-containing protein [Actinomycetota bacterium]